MDNQFIEGTGRDYDGTTLKVSSGSGMGLLHSGIISDAAFWVLCEADWCCSPATMSLFGIGAYCRFRDGIWFLASDRGLAK